MSATSQIAFTPLGPTVVVPAAAVAPLGVQAPTSSNGTTPASGQYRVVNGGDTTVFLAVGTTASDAQAKAVAPVAGVPSSAIAMVPGAVEVLSFGESAFFSGVSSAASTLYVTPGSGV
jgi:hypothetical protein